MRHTNAGLAIPDFPLMFGHIVPDHWDAKIAIHFAHRVGAVIVALAIIATAGHVWHHQRRRRELTRPGLLLAVLVAVQVTLGALTVLSERDVWINSFHVVCGALVLTTSLVLTLRTWRARFVDTVRLKPVTVTGGVRGVREVRDVREAVGEVRVVDDGRGLPEACVVRDGRDVRDERSVRLQPDRTIEAERA
jgi:heme A synthase